MDLLLLELLADGQDLDGLGHLFEQLNRLRLSIFFPLPEVLLA